ncbi:MAG TPA: glucuronide transporter [Actinoplanes sp.]|jgi:glucuronide carrier protein|nr:glucuronide transporter [Actinoplanes sp.]
MKLSIKSIVGYGAGDVANNLAFTLGTTFLLLYYTDVVGLSAAAIGTMFLVVRLWDAFADLFAGRMVDRTMTRWGKFRPFIIFGAIPLLFLSVLTFAVPTSLTGGAALLYAYLTYGVLGLVYSLVNVPYGSLATAMTQQPRERAKLATARGLGAGLAGMLLTFLIAPQIQGVTGNKTLSAAARAAELQSIFLRTTLLFVAIGFALYFLTFRWCRENVIRTQPRVSVKETFRTLKTNKPLGILCGSSFFYLIGLFAVGGATAYYAIYVLGDARYIIWMTLVTVAVQFGTAPFVPRLVARFGKKNLYQYCGFFTVAGGVALFFTPASLPALALVCVAVKGFGVQLINTLMFALEADTVEYGEWKTGQRTEGATYAIFSFTRKVTQSIGGALGAFALAAGGYLTTLGPGQVQPDSAILAIKVSLGLVPAAAALLAMLVFTRYPLTEKRYRDIVRETEERKRALLAEPAIAPVPLPATV